MTKKSSDRFPLSISSSSSSSSPLANPKTRSTVHSFRVRLEQLRSRYSRVTGESFRLERVDRNGPSELYQLVAADTPPLDENHHLGLGPLQSHSPPMVEQLTAAINGLLDQLHATETALWRREAELAAGVPVSPRPNESSYLADRLTAILRSATELIGGVAAGLYMLDEGTVELKLRAAWNLPADRLLESARPLRGATADLEALVGHAVLMKDARLVPDWKIPEDYPAAICVPVSSPTTPLGTLWIFCDLPRDFSHREVEMLEIVAGRIAAELEREMLLVESLKARELDRQIHEAGCYQQEQRPTFPPVLEDWDLAAWTTSADQMTGEFHDWGVLPDGRAFLALGSMENDSLAGTLATASVHAALKAHTAYPHGASQMLERINETLWAGLSEARFASLFYAILDPERGELEYAFAGRVQGWIASPRGVRPLTQAAPMLGVGPATPYIPQRARMLAGESLVLGSHGLLTGGGRQLEPARRDQLVSTMRVRNATADDLVERLRLVARPPGPGSNKQGATLLVAKRLATP